MKRRISLLVVLALVICCLAGCGSKEEDKTIKVGASTTPHAEILKVAAELLKEKGYTLEIVEFQDFVLPNTNLEDGQLYANYFQHQPYLDDFNKEKGTHIVSVAQVHYEPYGLYPGKVKAVADLKAGDQIAVPSDNTNQGRALLLLQQEGIITLKEGAGMSASLADIETNNTGVEIIEIEAGQIPRSLQDIAAGVINGNYAINAGLNVAKDAIAVEDADSIAAKTYANVLCVKEGNEDTDKTKALVEALLSEKVKQYIIDTYEGAVVPSF